MSYEDYLEMWIRDTPSDVKWTLEDVWEAYEEYVNRGENE